jgi:hypothetical protein
MKKFSSCCDRTETEFAPNGQSQSVAETSTYDTATGNPTTKTAWGFVQAGNDGTFTDIGNNAFVTQYAYVNQNFLSALPLSMTTSQASTTGQASTTAQVSTMIASTTYFYDNLPFGQVQKGNVTRQEIAKTATTSFRNDCISYSWYEKIPTTKSAKTVIGIYRIKRCIRLSIINKYSR